MGTNFDVVLFTHADRLHHDEGIAGVESAGYVGNVDEWEELFVWTAFQVAEAFAKVDVEESSVLDRAHDLYC